MVFMFLYQALWTFAFFFCIPIAAVLRKGRLRERLTFGLSSEPIEGENIWIHALSVGEVISALSLVETLQLKYPNRNIVFSVTTSTGMTVAQSELGDKVRALVFMPFDFWWCVHRIVHYIRPCIFVLVETDIWPALTNYLKTIGIKSILINGRISPPTFRVYRKFAFLARRLFDPFALCLMSSSLDARRLLKTGIRPREKVIPVGNIKFDREWQPMDQMERQGWLDVLNLGVENLIWVAGSIHPGEEKILMAVYKRLHPLFHGLRLVLAPRAVSQAGAILKEAQRVGIEAVLKSSLSNHNHPYDVLILNTMGELGRIYGLGHVSFVGGSLVPEGGHNLLEPASFGCPVLFGPHTEDFATMSELLIEAEGGQRVRDEKELFETMARLLSDPDTCNRMGKRAKAFVKNNRGALKRVVRYIIAHMDDNGGRSR